MDASHRSSVVRSLPGGAGAGRVSGGGCLFRLAFLLFGAAQLLEQGLLFLQAPQYLGEPEQDHRQHQAQDNPHHQQHHLAAKQAQYAQDGSAAVLAVLAGNDMLVTTDFQSQIPQVIAAVEDGTIPEEQINESVARVLSWKYQLGLLGN